jgi:hypothetical protein
MSIEGFIRGDLSFDRNSWNLLFALISRPGGLMLASFPDSKFWYPGCGVKPTLSYEPVT